MFLETDVDRNDLAQSLAAFRDWLEPRMKDGRYFGWMATEADEDVVIGGLGMVVLDWPPHPRYHPNEDARGYVLNLYVESAFRGRGVARELLLRALEEAKRRGLRSTTLHPTAQAESLYAHLGWGYVKEMFHLV